jgi:hypothetical protein
VHTKRHCFCTWPAVSASHMYFCIRLSVTLDAMETAPTRPLTVSPLVSVVLQAYRVQTHQNAGQPCPHVSTHRRGAHHGRRTTRQHWQAMLVMKSHVNLSLQPAGEVKSDSRLVKVLPAAVESLRVRPDREPTPFTDWTRLRPEEVVLGDSVASSGMGSCEQRECASGNAAAVQGCAWQVSCK